MCHTHFVYFCVALPMKTSVWLMAATAPKYVSLLLIIVVLKQFTALAL